MLCELLTRSASLENPAISLSDPQAWDRLFGTESSSSGVAVNSRTSLEVSPLWAGLGILMGDVSQVPTFVLRRLENGGKERDVRHPAYRLLRRKSSPSQNLTASMWKAVMVGQSILHGNAFAEIVRDGAARPVDLPILPPDQTRLEKLGSRLWYVTGPDRRKVRPENVFHLRGICIDAMNGLSLLDYAKHSIGRARAMELFAGRFFGNSTVPDGFFTHPGVRDRPALNQLQASMRQMFGGVNNAHRVAVFEEGVTWHALGIDAEKAQLINAMSASVKDIARWLQMPPHKLGDDSRVSYNSVEQEELAYKFSTLGNWFCKFRDEAYEKLLTERQKQSESHLIEEQQNQFLRADAKTRHEVYAIGLQWGIYSRDEVRAFENLNPIPDGSGQEFMTPMNMESGQDDEPEETEEPDVEETEDGEDIRASQSALLYDASHRAAKRLKQSISRGCKESELIGRHHSIVTSMFVPAVASCKSLGIDIPEASVCAKRFIESFSNGKAKDNGQAISSA